MRGWCPSPGGGRGPLQIQAKSDVSWRVRGAWEGRAGPGRAPQPGPPPEPPSGPGRTPATGALRGLSAWSVIPGTAPGQCGTMVAGQALHLRKPLLGKCVPGHPVLGTHFWLLSILPWSLWAPTWKRRGPACPGGTPQCRREPGSSTCPPEGRPRPVSPHQRNSPGTTLPWPAALLPPPYNSREHWARQGEGEWAGSQLRHRGAGAHSGIHLLPPGALSQFRAAVT